MKALNKICLLLFMIIPLHLGATEDLPKDSLYRIETNWTDQNSKQTPIKSFRDEIVVLAMTYTNCQYSCPMTIKKLQTIEKDFKKKGVTGYRFVVASFDPEKDTPEALNAYMKKKSISTENWTFLSAKNDEEVRKLAVLLEINYQKIEGGDFSHSNTITMLDPLGTVAYRLPGLNSPHEELVTKAASYKQKK